uniref:Uncharacterized protein n=2 Tax=Oryza sativa subsp. japonica TaxID=39947 RepID=Q8S5D6_ORYSJ|nr:Unknown protein [Oryza sativa Japonica Group]AAP51908.1 hypothetical protein LOC_Os10g03080 [Oryza sativa Japonica Group]
MKRRLSRLFKKGLSSPSSRHDESSARSSVDVSMEEAEVPPRLLNDADLDLVGDRELQAYYMLKDRLFAHTRAYDLELLQKIGCTHEISLPNSGCHLYNCHELTIPLQTIEESHVGVSYMDTRNMARNKREGSTSSTLVQMYKADWEPTGDAHGWTQAPRHSTGGSTWQNASESRWQVPHDVHWGNLNAHSPRSSGMPPSPDRWRSSSSYWDLGEITRRMDTLDMQTGQIQHNLEEHIVQTQGWQQNADAQFTNINNLMQQQHNVLQAYFRFEGFNPYQ